MRLLLFSLEFGGKGLALVNLQDQVERRFAVFASQWSGNRVAANAVFMDFRDAKQVLWDVVKGVDDDDGAFIKLHGSIEP